MQDFDYLSSSDHYFDSACQSLRPQPVIDSLTNYYTQHNSCGERVKYNWGRITDEKVAATRAKVLDFLKLKKRDYSVSFTLNTTYGINLLLSQFNPQKAQITQIITSDIEHNSPFLASMSFAKTNHLPRKVISRQPDGSINLSDLEPNSLVVVNCASNFDGRKLQNIKEFIKTVHKSGGYVIIDAAQAMAHGSDLLHKTDADAICFSAHKMYAPSLGVIVVKKSFLKFIDTSFIGGGMVDDVNRDTYILSSDNPAQAFTKFEAGLQAWGEIIALGAAIDWLSKLPKSDHQNLANNTSELFNFLKSHPKIHLINQTENPTMSFYVENLDSHLLGSALADENIMARTGYFCAHYYLDHVMHYPPLLRLSLGYHNRPEDITAVISQLSKL